MQQAAGSQYFEMSNLNNDLNQQIGHPIMNPVVPQANADIEINPTLNEDQLANQQQVRYNFLYKYYVALTRQLVGIFIIFYISQAKCISQFFLSEVNREWWGSNQTYEYFRRQNGQGYTRQEYNEWMEEKRQQYLDYKFNWFYYFILALTVVFTLFVLLTRSHRKFAQYQNRFKNIQIVLFGTLLGGYASVSQNSWKYDNKFHFISFSLLGLSLNAIVNYILVRKSKIQIYGKIKKISMFIFFGINFLMGFIPNYRAEALPIVEFAVLYIFFYFDNLNSSLLIQPEELPPTVNILQILKNSSNSTLLQQNPESDNIYFVINKKLLATIAIILGLVLFQVIIYFANEVAFIYVSVLLGLTSLSFIGQTQVAQQNLEVQDVGIAVMMTYLDILCPIPNIIRSIKK